MSNDPDGSKGVSIPQADILCALTSPEPSAPGCAYVRFVSSVPSEGAAPAPEAAMPAAHGRTAIAPAAPITGTAKGPEDHDDKDETQHLRAPPFCIRAGLYIKRPASRNIPQCKSCLLSAAGRQGRRLTVRSHAFAFGYSLATITVYQIPPRIERPPDDN